MTALPTVFTQHNRRWRDNHFVYPVVSRRSRGVSVGVNLNPDGVCNFDCVYCGVDRTRPLLVTRVDLKALAAELDGLLGLVRSGRLFDEPAFNSTPFEFRRLNDVAFSGDGEPTVFSGFKEAAELVVDALAAHGLEASTKIVVITNATLLHRPAVVSAIEFLDAHHGEIWAKLDAGTEAYYRTIERTSVPLSRVLANIRDTGKLRPIVIQSLFMNLDGHGPGDAEIHAYVERLSELRRVGCQINRVQVYTVARVPAETCVTPLSDRAVDAIGEVVRATGLPVETFYGPT